MSEKVFVSDFDGTMTKHDFYQLAIKSLIPPDCPDFWQDYRAGRISHFQALQAYFARIEGSEKRLLALLPEMKLDPELRDSLLRLMDTGWKVIVTSAGCDWYIRHLFDAAGVKVVEDSKRLASSRPSVVLYSNPGQYSAGKGLQMRLPVDSPYFSPTVGVDKVKVVRDAIKSGATVAFAGDGFPDAGAARLVPERLRFARRDLAEQLDADGQAYRRFEVWSEIAKHLVETTKA